MDLFISTLLLKYPFQIVHINLLQDDAYIPGTSAGSLTEQYFGEIKNELFFKERAFLYRIQKTFIHVADALLRVIPIDYAQTKGLDHGNSSTPWSRLSTNSRPRYSKYGVFLVRQLATLLTIWTSFFKQL